MIVKNLLDRIHQPLAMVSLFFAAIGLYLWIFPKEPRLPVKSIATPVEMEMVYKGQRIDLERAVSRNQLATGLMHRESLATNTAMLLVLGEQDSPVYVWAKNVKFPIDVVFLSLDSASNTNKVISTASLEPCVENKECKKIPVPEKTYYIVEANKGLSQKMSLTAGSIVTLKLK
jgi:uncharacterized membrane protein (UPF0127 family)